MNRRRPWLTTALRRRGASLLLVVAACSPSAREAPPAQAPAPSGEHPALNAALLPRLDATVADRAHWFELLRWPDSCEQEFAQTRLTDDGGLEFHLLEPGLSLVVVRCALGAYQPTSTVLLLDERRPAPAATVLEFATFESLDGKTLSPARTAELAGEIEVLAAPAALTVLTLARQLGDCGTWARYELRRGAPVLTAFAERVACPEVAGARANPRPGAPPAGWRAIQPI